MDTNVETNKIRNCKLAYECPLLWENLQETKDPAIRFCNKCKENVVHVKNAKELMECKSKCVMFDVDVEEISPASIPPKNEQEEPKVEIKMTNFRTMGRISRAPR